MIGSLGRLMSRSGSTDEATEMNGRPSSIRARSNSTVRLDYYQRLVYKSILRYQDPVSGLFPGACEDSKRECNEAWIRDNVYSILSVWALALAYRKNSDLDEDRAKSYELQQRCIKNMRSLLCCMMKQADKVENFKRSQSPTDSLHAKYGIRSMKTVVGDSQYGHLQLDAVSLYMLTLAQMTASGVQIIYTLDEVAFVQNLVFYIEAAYRIPDYGVWERGDKTNKGETELNSSSIGMAKAALEAINDLDLFGSRGGPGSVIHCIPDETQKCQVVLQSMLPRESNSKEVDAALLAIIGYPAFAVEDTDLIDLTRRTLIDKLQGRYGLKRFLRDGYRTCREDSGRLYYESWELKTFESIECEWPVFFCYLLLDALFNSDHDMAEEYWEALEEVVIRTDDGLKLIPELYAVPHDKIEAECAQPHSQDRIPIGRKPFLWGQSLYILCCLIREGFVAIGEIDPLCRRYVTEKKPDNVVQIVVLAANESVRLKGEKNGITGIKTVQDVSPVEVYPARVLSYIYGQLGKSDKLNLTGRTSSQVGVLSTSTLYQLQDRIIAFTPQFLDQEYFYLASDTNLLIDMFRSDIAFLKSNWSMLGRPTTILEVTDRSFDENGVLHPALAATFRKCKTGYLHGARVVLGQLSEFLNTSCMYTLQFLDSSSASSTQKARSRKGTTTSGDDIRTYLDRLMLQKATNKPQLPVAKSKNDATKRRLSRDARMRAGSIAGIIRRTRSIQVDVTDPGIIDIRNRHPSGSGDSSVGTLSPAAEARSRASTADIHSPEYFHSSTTDRPIFSQTIDERGERKSVAALPEVDVPELLEMLRMTESLGEQAEIIHYLYLTKGLNFETKMPGKNLSFGKATVADLVKELYDKACQTKKWWLVRHSAGMLAKRVEDLARSVSDLLVHKKQITVGMPSDNEITITRPLPPDELQAVIRDAYKLDTSTAMLTQELLMYLAMFIRTEPALFHDLLRLRIGLIIQIMAAELARALKCKGEDASEYLLNLSPYEMKILLHHILSGKEIGIQDDDDAEEDAQLKITPTLVSKARRSGIDRLRKSMKVSTKSANLMRMFSQQDVAVVGGGGDSLPPVATNGVAEVSTVDVAEFPEKTGRWLRRRRIDGALNRLPEDFYPRIWHLLEKSQGLNLTEAMFLSPHLTNEMTAGELKFALHVENILSTVSQPEYRQLLLESLMTLTMLVEYEPRCRFSRPVDIRVLVLKAYALYLADQMNGDGDSTMCCAVKSAPLSDGSQWTPAPCGGAAGICLHFYDTAPSGRFGTMTYLCRAAAVELPMFIPSATAGDQSQLECNVM